MTVNLWYPSAPKRRNIMLIDRYVEYRHRLRTRTHVLLKPSS